MRSSTEAAEEAAALKELFGAAAEEAVERRITLALNRAVVEDVMFWLDVQTHLYQTSY